ncbi:MAG: hypothetical protein JKY37_12740 [Nannocystaceae bacterium]|nr:hypothetical protein [Nannocystaceae bacterium]
MSRGSVTPSARLVGMASPERYRSGAVRFSWLHRDSADTFEMVEFECVLAFLWRRLLEEEDTCRARLAK